MADETKPLTAYSLLVQLAEAHHNLWSVERPCTPASKSELRRWILNGSVEINYSVDRDPNEVIDYPVVSVVIHPKSTGSSVKAGVVVKHTRRTTLWFKALETK